MSREVNVLNYIYENQNVTQREIAKHTGLSLGGVNLLLKKMIEAGWIRVLALKNPKLVQYILTPEGMREKTVKTYNFITRNYRQILKARQVILTVLKSLEDEALVGERELMDDQKGLEGQPPSHPPKEDPASYLASSNNPSPSNQRTIYLYGEKDELFEIIKMIIEEELGGFGNRYKYCGNLDKLEETINSESKTQASPIVIIWNVDYHQRFEDRQINYINILEQIKLDETQ